MKIELLLLLLLNLSPSGLSSGSSAYLNQNLFSVELNFVIGLDSCVGGC